MDLDRERDHHSNRVAYENDTLDTRQGNFVGLLIATFIKGLSTLDELYNQGITVAYGLKSSILILKAP